MRWVVNLITPFVLKFSDQPDLDVNARLVAALANVLPRVPDEA